MGVTIHGESITAPLIGTNWLFGALAGQGKTATMRLLALGVALDVTAEIRIVNFKPSGDWNAFTPRASVLLVGMGTDVITACADQLEWLVIDMQRRSPDFREGMRDPDTADQLRLADIQRRHPRHDLPILWIFLQHRALPFVVETTNRRLPAGAARGLADSGQPSPFSARNGPPARGDRRLMPLIAPGRQRRPCRGMP